MSRKFLRFSVTTPNMQVEKQFVDSHGQSEVAFAFTHLLGFKLMPRIKRIHVQKIYLPNNEIRSE